MENERIESLQKKLKKAELDNALLFAQNQDLSSQNARLMQRESELFLLAQKNGVITQQDWTEFVANRIIEEASAKKNAATDRSTKQVFPLPQELQ